MQQRTIMALAPSKLAHAAWGKLPEGLRRRFRSEGGKRLLRFAPAAVLALLASQITFFVCTNLLHTTGGISGAAGWLAGAAVSYGVSRWAWERKGRPNLLKETLPFLGISLVAGAILTETSHFASVIANDHGMHGLERAVFLQGIYLTANCFTFLMRFVIFHYLLFADRDRAAEAAS
jgi:putative flippase GtrA